jgi:hypothetical protein
MLGLVTDVDNDAGGEQTKKSAPKTNTPPQDTNTPPAKPKQREDGMLVIPTKKDVDAALYHNIPIEELVGIFKMNDTQCDKYTELLNKKNSK